MRQLIKENLRISKEIHSMVKAMRKHMMWQRVWTLVKILLIAIPLIISIIYLPPLLNQLSAQYSGLIDATQSMKKGMDGMPTATSTSAIEDLMKKFNIKK